MHDVSSAQLTASLPSLSHPGGHQQVLCAAPFQPFLPDTALCFATQAEQRQVSPCISRHKNATATARAAYRAIYPTDSIAAVPKGKGAPRDLCPSYSISTSHLLYRDDSLLGITVRGDFEHLHPFLILHLVSHVRVLPDVRVLCLHPPDGCAHGGCFNNAELIHLWRRNGYQGHCFCL